MQVYSGVDELPSGHAGNAITPGCLVLEGGAWRGIYTQGALDALMEENINFQTTIGISAGGMSGIGYVSGQIGWAPRVNLTFRQDPEYCGWGAMKRDHGITGFSYLFHDIMKQYPIDEKRFNDPARRFLVVATNCETGKPVVFEKGKCNIFRAIQASATVPYISRPVMIRGIPFLDGGCSVKIPYEWAVKERLGKIAVIRTRDRSFRKEIKKNHLMADICYRHYPNLRDSIKNADSFYNAQLDRIDADEASGKIFVLAPSGPVTISRFESDMEKLGALYHRGYDEMKEAMPRLLEYLSR